MEIGIIGFPYSGKSTIFSTLMKHKSSDLPGAKQNAERGIVKVPDARLNRLVEMFNPKKEVPATIEYIKVPGFEQLDEPAKGLPAQFLTNLKNTNALMIVIRDFENPVYPHPLDRVKPKDDIEFIQSEFLLSDLVLVEGRCDKLIKQIAKTQNDKDKRELALMNRLKEHLEKEHPLRELDFSEQELIILRGYQFITLKPVLYVINTAEDRAGMAAQIEQDFSYLLTPRCAVTVLSAEIEKELSDLSEEDAQIFMQDLGIVEPALHKLIRTSYELLGLISFFTVGEDECRSWTIQKGTNAQRAAGVIHTDLEKGFIRAEIVHYDDLSRLGSLNACKEKGLLRLEGKEYLMKDGDTMNVRFNI
jgi:GTP-binding protein YchF